MKWVKTIDELHLPCLSLLSINISALQQQQQQPFHVREAAAAEAGGFPSSDLSALVESQALKIWPGFFNFCPPASSCAGLSFLWVKSQLLGGIRAQECFDRER